MSENEDYATAPVAQWVGSTECSFEVTFTNAEMANSDRVDFEELVTERVIEMSGMIMAEWKERQASPA